MKKVMLLVLTVMLVSAFLMASGPSLRIVRLEVINKSGNEVMIKLEGSDIGKQFYYLTIAAGTKTFPEVATFTVLEDIYTRTTWYGEGKYAQCVGTSSSGQLVMDKNVRLVFTDCYVIPKRTAKGDWHPPTDGKDVPWYCAQNEASDICQLVDPAAQDAFCAAHPGDCVNVGGTNGYYDKLVTNNYGEPGMEKVVYYTTVKLTQKMDWDNWDPWGSSTNVYWKRGCGNNSYFWYISYQRAPYRGLCQWRYLYDKTHEW